MTYACTKTTPFLLISPPAPRDHTKKGEKSKDEMLGVSTPYAIAQRFRILPLLSRHLITHLPLVASLSDHSRIRIPATNLLLLRRLLLLLLLLKLQLG